MRDQEDAPEGLAIAALGIGMKHAPTFLIAGASLGLGGLTAYKPIAALRASKIALPLPLAVLAAFAELIVAPVPP